MPSDAIRSGFAEADQLIDWADRALGEIDWSRVVPDFRAPLVTPRMFDDEPPLTYDMVVQCASLQHGSTAVRPDAREPALASSVSRTTCWRGRFPGFGI